MMVISSDIVSKFQEMTGAGKPLAVHSSVTLSPSDTEILLFDNGLTMVTGAASGHAFIDHYAF